MHRLFVSLLLLGLCSLSPEAMAFNARYDKVVSPDTTVTYNFYDAENRLIVSRKMLQNQLLFRKTYQYNDRQLIKETDHNGRSISYSYDEAGRKIAELKMDRLTSFEYDDKGRLALEKKHAENGRWTGRSFLYDALDRLLQENILDSEHPLLRYTTYRYDAQNNVTEEQCFDPSDKLLSRKNRLYDEANNLVQVIENAGTRFLYNQYGQIETTIQNDGTTLHHSYDTKGRLERLRAEDGTFDYTYKYDKFDRQIKATNNLTERYSRRKYNDFDEIISEKLESGKKITYSYDKAGRHL